MRSLICAGLVAISLLDSGSRMGVPKRAVAPTDTSGDKRTNTPFDGERAYQYLKRQTDFGARVPGSKAHEECLRFLTSELKTFGGIVRVQTFAFTQPRLGRVMLSNIIAQYRPAERNRVALTAHWDCRPWADEDADPERRKSPVPGANDGASGVAVLTELAREIAGDTTCAGVDVVLFDGEDMGTRGTLKSWCTGSKYFAAHLPHGFAPRFAINLDMVGDTYLSIPRERNSDRYAHDVMNLVFSTAKQIHASAFVDVPGEEIYDDHVPLNEAGIKAIDLIDFNYVNPQLNYWHTVEDTPDKCSAESLGEVGTVLFTIIHNIHRKGTP